MKHPQLHTLPARALARMLSGKHISHRDFQNAVATYRLSATIHILRNDGWPIQDVWHEEKTSDPTGRNARFKKYYLPENLITELGEEGRKYRTRVLEWEAKRMRTKGEATPKVRQENDNDGNDVESNDSRWGE